MPYAQFSTISVHLPSRKFAHYAFLIEPFEHDRTYIWEDEPYSLSTTVKAGIYGFTNREHRDSFISIANRSSENEIAYIAAVE